MIEDPYLGKYVICVSARSTDKEILKKAQDGGVATALMVYALEQGIIDRIVPEPEGGAHRAPDAAAGILKEILLEELAICQTRCR